MKRPLIRRTFSQERYEVLMKRQKKGYATFKDLTELDEIVNRDPAIRETILDEMQGSNGSAINNAGKRNVQTIPKPTDLFGKIKVFLNRLWLTRTAMLIPAYLS